MFATKKKTPKHPYINYKFPTTKRAEITKRSKFFYSINLLEENSDV